ncbi:MAG: Sialate O-acetylesterase [Xylanivirga thermophila]|uniref:sialate O-acetylesterase n=1 Tax=Xylanivirga thermophila TaxID=2496273 RepID=UPI0039F47089
MKRNTNVNKESLKLPRLISDGMIMQRNVKVRIWGWASSGRNVTINFLDREYDTISDRNGKWSIFLPKLEAGGPYTMEVRSGNQTIIIKDILVGDVWVCSGQSNMVLPMSRVEDFYADEIASCDNEQIRLFIVPDRYDFKSPRQDFKSGKWESANHETILNFTAVGYFFAKTLFKKYNIPIGLINASVGGSPVEAWLSEEALQSFPKYLKTVSKLKDDEYINQIKKRDEMTRRYWYSKLNHGDKGLNKKMPWYDINYDASKWPIMHLPTYWEDAGLEGVNGVVWFRREVDIPAYMAGYPARLLLGTIVDSDIVYVNGCVVGRTTYQYPPRKYNISKGLLKEGKNIIVVRVVSESGKGGFIKDKPYQLEIGDQIIDLKGEWQYKVGTIAKSLAESTFFEYKPLGLFNGMIAPLLDYRIKGVIWYQGESNTSEPKGYSELFSALITDWRQKWDQGDFPFLFVQLANYEDTDSQIDRNNWALLREEQLKTLSVPNTAMAVTIDIGEWNDLHPSNKEDVGYRLALAAQNLAYGDSEVVYSGPIYESMEVLGDKIIITFSNIGGGLVTKGDGELRHFFIAGSDKKFIEARAKIIKENQVMVWNENLSKPVVVRYAWADNPEEANLYNKEGLPACPFRTDS